MIRVRLVLLLTSLVCLARAADGPKLPEPEIVTLAFPTAANSRFSPMARSDSGEVWVMWAAKAPDGTTLFASSISTTTKRWSDPRRIGKAPAPLEGTPSIAFAGRNALAVWSSAEKIYVSVSHDGGRSWDGPKPALGANGHYPVIAALADGSFEMVWLEKTATEALPNLAKVNVEHVAPNGKTSSVKTIALDACDCCAPGPFLLSRRGRPAGLPHPGGGPDPRCAFESPPSRRVVGFGDDQLGWLARPLLPWQRPPDRHDGGRVAAIWYTGADNEGRLLTSGSPDAGNRF